MIKTNPHESVSTTSSVVASSPDSLLSAARITVVFVFLYSITFTIQLVMKRKLLMQARRNRTKFDRYQSPEMHKVDRLNANFLEWSPVFLGLLWSLAATQKLDVAGVMCSWTYVGLRALYMLLILRHGVAQNGMNTSLWISTFPAYICLMILGVQAFRSLF